MIAFLGSIKFVGVMSGIKDVEIMKIEEIGDRIALHVQLPKCTHQCPVCKKETSKVHDYRVKKINHLK